jgi:uncharacterized protein YdeI (YjbR/CyaY-like superfamily)
MADRSDAEQVHVETREQWRAWLVANHERTGGAWMVTWKTHTGRPRMPYAEGVEEALCFGWIDSTGRRIDDDRSALWYAPRKKGSGWSRPNKERLERLRAAGLMTAAGERVVAAAVADGSWTLLDAAERLEVPDDLAAALDEHEGARAAWDGFPPSARRALLAWIDLAKRPATRAGRITETAEQAALGRRANQWPKPMPDA